MKAYLDQKDGYILRLACPDDAEAYYEQNYNPLDAETARLTGSKASFSREEVVSFFRAALHETDRRWFFLCDPQGKIAAECLIFEIDPQTRCAAFRIAFFHPEHRGHGLGTWFTRRVVRYAFEVLRLHRLELEVFSFNPRAQHVYEKAGFRKEGVRRDAVLDNGRYADVILMAILEDEWRAQNEIGAT